MSGSPAALPGAPGPVWYPFRRLVGAVRKLWRGFPFPYRLPWGGWMLLHLDGTGLGLLHGTYPEHPELRMLSRLVQPGMTVLDVGANQGIYTIVAAKVTGAQGHVYAFEPSPSELAKLRWNLRLNHLGNVTVVESAVSSFSGQTAFCAAEPMRGGFSGLHPPSERLHVLFREITVPVTTLDEFVRDRGIAAVDFLKVDVEGAELELIEGARALLSGEHRPVVQFEFADGRAGEWGYRASEIGERLIGLGYRLFSFRGWDLEPHVLKNEYAYEDVIGVPEDRLEAVTRVTGVAT